MKNFGLIIPERAPEDYIALGGNSKIHKEIRREDGQWVGELPTEEIQLRAGFESYSCVSFGTLSALEILLKVKYNE